VLRIRTRNEAHHVAKKMTGPTKQSSFLCCGKAGLLRFARNDG
jgi:hypothetical protein